MNLKAIKEAFSEAVGRYAYPFHCGDIAALPKEVKSFPAAWLEPPRVQEVDGRRQGRITYQVRLHLLRGVERFDAAQSEAVLRQMEREILEVFSGLSQKTEIIAVERLTVQPRYFGMSGKGDIAITGDARVITWF